MDNGHQRLWGQSQKLHCPQAGGSHNEPWTQQPPPHPGLLHGAMTPSHDL